MRSSVRSIRAASLAAAVATTLVAAGVPSGLVHAAAAPAAVTAQSPALEAKVDQIAARFYDARAKYDPLLYATANGDSRYDDQIGMAIDPKVRKRYLAANHAFLKQLRAIDRARLTGKAQLNYDILAAEIQAQLDLERFPEHLLPLNHFDNIPSNLANYASCTACSSCRPGSTRPSST
jgi:uncharacterized protein (DUF885 family)